MKKILSLFAALFLCIATTHAQSHIPEWKGFRFSYDRVFMEDNQPGDRYDNGDPDMNGFTFDYIHSFNITRSIPLFIETGGGLSYAKSKYKFYESLYEAKYEYQITTDYLNMTIPVNIVYGINISRDIHIKPYTGFSLKTNLLAKSQIQVRELNSNRYETDNINHLKQNNEEKDLIWKPVLVSWQIGTALDVNNYNIGLAYNIDLYKISQDFRAHKIQVFLGYNF